MTEGVSSYLHARETAKRIATATSVFAEWYSYLADPSHARARNLCLIRFDCQMRQRRANVVDESYTLYG